MRRASKVDRNQAEIVSALRQIGASVQDLSSVGQGCPDLLVGYRNVNYCIEVKDGELPPSARKLTKAQVKWHSEWHGQKVVVKTIEEAIECVTK